jgi:hypothetical protein
MRVISPAKPWKDPLDAQHWPASTQPAWALAGRTLTAFPLAIGHARTPRCLGGMPEENVFDLGPRRPELPRAV